jgi:hypothetical protein
MAARCPAAPSPPHSVPSCTRTPLIPSPRPCAQAVDAHGLDVCCTPLHFLLLADCTFELVRVCLSLGSGVHMLRALGSGPALQCAAVWLSRACTHPPVCSVSLFQRDWNLTLSHRSLPPDAVSLAAWVAMVQGCSSWRRQLVLKGEPTFHGIPAAAPPPSLVSLHGPLLLCDASQARQASVPTRLVAHRVSVRTSGESLRTHALAAPVLSAGSDMPSSPNMTGLLCLCSSLPHCMTEDDCRWEFVVSDGG